MAVMKRHGQRNESTRLRRAGSRPHHRRLDTLARTALVVAIGMGLPALAYAGRTTHIAPSVHDGHQPTVVQAKNGTPVVNIVAPGKHGISHNEYTRFDVGQKGLILNNSADISKTKLAGYITGNKHLVGTGPAGIILNEVVSTQPSQLDGYMEIAGTPAELIVANPNGIACDGCGFINTPRAVLTTGKPVVGNDGRLTGFRVTQGRIRIQGAGLDASHTDRVDLLARAVDINAKLWARQLDVIAGANRVALGSLSAIPIGGLGDKPDMAIDVAALGGMYAHAIYLVGTEAGVGVDIQGVAAAQAGDFTLTGAGKVVLDGQVTATGTVTVGTPQSVDVHGVLASAGAMAVRGRALDLAGTVYSNDGIVLDAADDIRNQGQLQAHGGQLAVSAGGKVTNAARGVMYAGTDVTIDAGELSNAGGIEAVHGMSVDATGMLSNQGTLQADRAGLSLAAQALTNTGTLSAQGDLSAGASGKLDSSGQLIAGGNVAMQAGALVITGAVQAGQALTLTAGSLLNEGKLYALGGAWQAAVNGDAVNAAQGDMYAADGMTLKATTLTNHGLLEASGALAIRAGDTLANTGTVQSDHATLDLAAASLKNAGTLSAATDMTLDAATTLGNTATAVAGGSITLEGHDLDLAGGIRAGKALDVLSHGDASINGKLYALGGLLQATVAGALDNQADGDIYGRQGVTLASAGLSNLGNVASRGDLLVTVGSLDNRGQMQSEGHLELTGRKSIVNHGAVQSGAALTVKTGGDVDNAKGGLFYAATRANLRAGGDWRNAGSLYATGALDLAADTLHNAGVMRSGAGMDITIRRAARNAGTAYAVGGARWSVGGMLANPGVLASAADTRIVADGVQGNGTFAAGLKDDGSLGTDGNLMLQATGALQAGGRNLAAQNLALSGSALDLAGSRTFAGANASLVASAGDIVLSDATLTAVQAASFQAGGTLVNGGSTAADGGSISAHAIALTVNSLDNRYGRLEQSGDGDLDIHLNGIFDNAHGLLATNADNLSIQAASLDNTDGNIQHAGKGQLHLTSTASLDNQSGTIGSNGNAVFALGSALDNRSGSIGMLGDVTLEANAMDNRQGVLAGNRLHLTLAKGVENQGGTLQSADSLTLSAVTLDNGGQGAIEATGSGAIRMLLGGALTNAADAFIGGNGDVRIEAAQLTNAGQIYAGHALRVATVSGTVDNRQGYLQAMGAMWLDSAGALVNNHGYIEAGSGQSDATLAVAATALDNRGGRLANAGTGATTLAIDRDIVNQGGILGGQGNVQLEGASLANTAAGKLVAGRDLGLALTQLDNAGGTVYAARNLVWKQGGASLDNAGGSFGTGGNLTLFLHDVDNDKGNLDAGHDVTLDLASLDGTGRVVAGNNLGLTLPGDYTNGKGNILKANHDLSVTVGGDFSNPAGTTLEAVHALAVHAADLDNAKGAMINSAATSLTVDHALTNEGRIEGNSIALRATTLTNTGSVMGGDVVARAGKLVNGRDLGKVTGNTPYQTALIAATHSLDLYVSGTLLNQDASLFTLGDMTLAKNAAGDRSDKIVNRSGDIEADGNIVIAADRITNERRYYRFKTFKVSGNTIVGWDGHVAGTLARAQAHGLRAMMLPPTKPPGGGGTGGGGTPNTRMKTTYGMALGDATLQMQGYCGQPDKKGWRCLPGGTVTQVDTWTVTSVTLLTMASAEGRMLAGKNLTLEGSLLNDASTVSAGNNLVINGRAQSGEVSTAVIGGRSVRNVAHAPTLGISHHWSQSIKVQQRKAGTLGGHHWSTRKRPHVIDFHDTDPPTDGDMSWVTIDQGPTLSAHMSAGNNVSIHAHDIDNTVVDADGHPVRGAVALGGNSAGQTVSGNRVHDIGRVGKHGAAGGGVALGRAPDGTSGVASHGEVTTSVPQSVATLTGPDAHVALPQSGLYTVHKNPDSSYLVETDPRFTDYAAFISSDYLLSHLGYDPAAVGKRLGDGFYEERQVLDQITQLTGRRFLAADTDALDQYRALMDNAVTAAKKFDLSVGVALTADQMADLTHDLVWLVSEKVDGQSVLVPVVYLSQNDAQRLARSGAVIAGRNVVLDATGDINNNGSVVASHSASLEADNLLNRGTLAAGGSLGIQAAHDLLNQGGVIRGADVSLVAGHDVMSSADIGAVNIGGVNLGDFHPGSMTASGALSVHAGRDLHLDQASLKAGGDMVLSAGRDLSAQAGTLHAGKNLAALAGRDISLTATASHATGFDGRTLTTTTTHHVNQLDAGKNLTMVAGRDIASRGSQLKAGGTLGMAAGHDIDLGTVTDRRHTLTHWQKSHTTGTTATDDDTVRGNTLTGARGVSLMAGHDMTLTATRIAGGKGAIALQAGHDVHLNAGHEKHDWSQDTRTHHGGLLSSSTTTMHDATQDNLAIGTTFKGGAVSVVAGHDLSTQGASLAAAQGLVLGAGHDIDLGAAAGTHAEQYHRHTSKRGGGLGVLVGTSKNDLFTRHSKDDRDNYTSTHVTGTLLSGDTVDVVADHDLTAQAARIASTHALAMAAGHNLAIATGTDTSTDYQQHKTRVTGFHRSGLTGNLGSTKTRLRAGDTTTSHIGSLIGSTDGSVALSAGHNVRITGSDVLSKTGTTIVGQNVTIDAAVGRTDTHQDYTMHSAGIRAGLGGAIGHIVNGAYGAYSAAKRGGHARDKRVEALYAAQAAYQGYGIYKNIQADSRANDRGGSGVSLQLALGASAASSHADAHDDTALGSVIGSKGDIVIAATNGDLNVIGSRIQGNNVALSASRDINLLSQALHHIQKQSGAHAGGQVGVSVGSTTGIFLSLNGGKRRAHGNGADHRITTVDATDTLSLSAGHDLLLKGAQAKGNTLLASVGHNLTIQSERDTGDFASKQWNAGLQFTYGFGGGGVGVSGHYSQHESNGKYASVTQVSGLGAGNGGFHIYVGNHTDLIGGVVASTANPANNVFSTGSLSYRGIQNHASYSSSGFGIGTGYNSAIRGENKFSMAGTGLLVPTNDSRSNTTKSAIATGTLDIRDGEHSGISRDASWQNGQVSQYDPDHMQHRVGLANLFVNTTTHIVDGSYRWHARDATDKMQNMRNEADGLKALGDAKGAQQLRWKAFQLQQKRDKPDVSSVWLDTAAAAAGSLLGGSPDLGYVLSSGASAGIDNAWTWAGIGHNETLAVKVSCSKQENRCQNGVAGGGFQLTKGANPMARLKQLQQAGYTITLLDRIPNGAKNIATNGILNDLARASQVMMGFVAKRTNESNTAFYLQYNQTHGMLSDLFQAGWDKLVAPHDEDYSLTTLAMENALERSGGGATLYGHSWGSITTKNVLDIADQHGYRDGGLGVQIFGPAVGPGRVVDPLVDITGKSVVQLKHEGQIYYYNKYDDPVAGIAAGTALTMFWSKARKQYLDPKSDNYLPGASKGSFWEALRGFTKVFGSTVNPHSCYKFDCLRTPENWTVKDARLYGLDPGRYFQQLKEREKKYQQKKQKGLGNNAAAKPGVTP